MFHQRHAGCNRISTRSQDYRLQFRPEIDHRLQIPLEGGKLFRRGGFKPAAPAQLAEERTDRVDVGVAVLDAPAVVVHLHFLDRQEPPGFDAPRQTPCGDRLAVLPGFCRQSQPAHFLCVIPEFGDFPVMFP